MYSLCILYVMYRWLVILFLLLILTRFYYNSNQNGNENFEKKKNYEHTQGLTILSKVNSFCTNFKKIDLSKKVTLFHKIVNVLTKFCCFLEIVAILTEKYTFFVCVILFLTLYLDHLYFLYSLHHFVFSSLVWSLVKKRLFRWKKKVLIKTTLRENSAIWRPKEKINLREI